MMPIEEDGGIYDVVYRNLFKRRPREMFKGCQGSQSDFRVTHRFHYLDQIRRSYRLETVAVFSRRRERSRRNPTATNWQRLATTGNDSDIHQSFPDKQTIRTKNISLSGCDPARPPPSKLSWKLENTPKGSRYQSHFRLFFSSPRHSA